MNAVRRNHAHDQYDGNETNSKVNFYFETPSMEMDLDEFEQLAVSRLKILRKVEELKARNDKKKDFKIVDSMISSNFKSFSMDLENADIASHFILRAAYSRTEDLRRWFLTQETHLFRHRLEKLCLRPRSLRKALAQSGIEFEEVSEQEKEERRDVLLSLPAEGSNVLFSPIEFRKTPFFKIFFTEALDLVKARLVYIERGYAYVPISRLTSIVTARFRMHLSKSLTQASNAFSSMASESQRIAPLMQNMNTQYIGKQYGFDTALNDSDISHENIDYYAKEGFMPLCMQQVHKGLKRDHKLKYGGRLQYILFLKGAGLSLDESMIFFEREFSKIMSVEKFRKDHGYTIRHLYGKEGKMKNKTPYGCTRIILGNPPQGVNEHHGCPFKHYDEENLSNLLSSLRIDAPDRDAILEQKRQHNFQLACVKHFEVTHPNARSVPDIELDGVGNHPNAWFNASISYNKHKGGTSNDVPSQSQLRSVSPDVKY